MLARLARLWRRLAGRRRRRPTPSRRRVPTPTFDADVEAIGLSTIALVPAASRTPCPLLERRAGDARGAPRACTRSRARTIAAAERVLRHEFDLLGSGPFVPVDPDRPARDGYTPIDWYLDPVRRLRFPRGVPHKQWNLYEMRPGNADVKYPVGAGALPALGDARPGVPAHRRRSLRRRDRARARRLRRGQSRPASASTGPARWTSASAPSAGRSDSSWCARSAAPRRRVLAARLHGAVRPRRLHPQQPREHLRGHQQSLPQQRRSACSSSAPCSPICRRARSGRRSRARRSSRR